MIKVKNVTPSAAFAMTKKGALLVDVREPWEIAGKAFDVPHIMVIPLGKLAQRLQDVPANRNLVIACNSGNRSVTASRLFLSRGYHKVVNMERGIIGWEKEGLPVKRGQKKSLLSLLLQKFRKES